MQLPGGQRIDYVVDAQNRRIGKKVNGVLTREWLYQDQLNPVAELDSSGQIASRFIYGSRTAVPDYMVKGGAIYRLVTDNIGSVRLVVNDSTGLVVQRIDYDEFGEVTENTNPGFQPFGFAGGLYDDDTKLVRFGARDYDAETGRWTTRDLVDFAGGSGNLYTYASGDPVNRIDPSGLSDGDPGDSWISRASQWFETLKKWSDRVGDALGIKDIVDKFRHTQDKANQASQAASDPRFDSDDPDSVRAALVHYDSCVAGAYRTAPPLAKSAWGELMNRIFGVAKL